MLQPVGKLPPAVYWRRRLIFVVLPAVLVLIVVVYLLSGGGSAAPTATVAPSSARATGNQPARSPLPTAVTTAGAAPTTTPSPAVRPVVTALCTPADLRVQAATGKASYAVGSTPVLYLVVTNITAKPCRQDLADKQFVLTLTTGDVRAWGSHDCTIEPGVDIATLVPKVSVRRGIIWSGQTSAQGCPTPRYIAQAGAYELVATLAGQNSTPTAFVLTPTGSAATG